MSELPLDGQKLRRTVLVAIALLISVLFLWMIREFLMALLLAAIACGLVNPLYDWVLARVRGRRRLASGITVLIVLLGVIGPLTTFLGMVTSEALHLARMARPWVETQLSRASGLNWLFERFPQLEALRPYRDQILSKLGETAGTVGSVVVNIATAAARETATFFLLLFVMLYAMYFFLINGRAVLRKILYYLPLTADDERLMVERFSSVSRATIKGTVVIGAIQGALGGIAFAVAGLDGAAVWGFLMALLSAVPGIGAALVWVPAVVYLFATGQTLAATLLLAWCAGVVGSVDNVLRPWMVGKDTQMPDVLVLVSTLGGIVLFGPLGFIIGPVVAALFVTVWDLYGEAFKDTLPAVEP